MKLSTAFITLITTQIVGILAAPSDSAGAECGALGVMDWAPGDVPADAKREDLRQCREHPTELLHLEGRAKIPKLPKPNPEWEACVRPGSWGCHEGYCWDSCNRNQWCWLAYTDGKGDWIKCKQKSDCTGKHMSRAKCGVGSCKACGCGC